MRWVGDTFARSLEDVLRIVDARQPIALSRFGDGELRVLDGRGMPRRSEAYEVDGWSCASGASKLSEALMETATNNNLIRGIPCSCCNNRAKNDALRIMTEGSLTFANIFVNANYPAFVNWVQALNRPVFLIASEVYCHSAASRGDFPCSVSGFYPIPKDCVNYFEQNQSEFVRDMNLVASMTRADNRLILIAAGPLGTVAVNELWKANNDVQCLDVGSALDPWIFGKTTRPYQVPGKQFHGRVCVR